MKICISILTIAAVLLWAAAAEGNDSCQSNTDCPQDDYCNKTEGNCDGQGTCSPRPLQCLMIWDPVCGCDGVTYHNECYAAAAGVNIEYDGECLPSCTNNGDCEAGDYCSKAAGNCDGLGACSPRPEVCPDVWDPVCGCDGFTYSNACDAAAAGVNIEYDGECLPSCTNNSQCAVDSYCSKAKGHCDGQGACSPRPEICPAVWDPVCGCDRATYGNACYAAAAGVNVDYDGYCLPSCTDNSQCAVDDYCSKAAGNCDGMGDCSPRPEICPDVWDPVCGCDGATYSNECYAAAAGANADYGGQCLSSQCTSNSDCEAGDYCSKSAGDCDGQGTCSPRPEVCPDVWDPVCGCDGQTYANACEAAVVGVNVEYDGECLLPGPIVQMLDPRVADDDVHTGPSGLNSLRILWSEPIIFNSKDITIVNEDNAHVGFASSGSNTRIMTITFSQTLLHDIYTITVDDSAYSASTGQQIDGNNNGTAGGDFIFDMEHRARSDFNNNNEITFPDLAFFAEVWLAKLE